MLKSLNFNSFEFNSRQEALIGVDTSKKYVLKVQLVPNPRKKNTIKEEYEVMRHLNKSECVSCPKAYEYGKITKTNLLDLVTEKDHREALIDDEYEYILQEYISDSGLINLPDIVLSILEQKKLGVYQADIKPGNLRFDVNTSVCYIIDYDQAILLTDEQKSFPNKTFFNFCSQYDKQEHGIGNWLRHLPQYSELDLDQLFRDGSFNLGQTTILKTQRTTNSTTGIYHTIESDDIFADGSRKVDVRAGILDTLQFKEGEKVLDIGCNTGLLCQYLAARGCEVSGVDNDTRVVIVAKIISNILGNNIDYYHLDLDDAEAIKECDTIMLFSVLHHTHKVKENAKKIAQACNRIIIEARLFENGAQPYGDEWVRTSSWNFNDWEEFYTFCETIFPGFKLKNNLGLGSKNRNILELVKE